MTSRNLVGVDQVFGQIT